MSAPKIDGQNFPEYAHQEYPKVVYAGGVLGAESRTVDGPAAEEAAAEEGFTALVAPPAPEVEDDADTDGAADGEAEAGDGERFNGADPADFDHDGDGHPGGSLPKGKRTKA